MDQNWTNEFFINKKTSYEGERKGGKNRDCEKRFCEKNKETTERLAVMMDGLFLGNRDITVKEKNEDPFYL